MARKSNNELIDVLVKDASLEAQQILERSTGDIDGIMSNYPTFKNEFMNQLTNKVVATEHYAKVFNNPLAFLKKGKMQGSVEQLFTELAELKGLFEHFSNRDGVTNTTDEADLIQQAKQTLKVRYINNNYHYKTKVSLSNVRLRQACLDDYGLSSLSEQLATTTSNAIRVKEYENMRDTLIALAEYKNPTMDGATGQLSFTKALTEDIAPQKMHVTEVTTSEDDKVLMRNLSEAIRSTTGLWSFPSDVYNMAKVTTWSSQEDVCLVTTPQILAKMDVQSLADAFNVSKADVQVRTILVDKLPQSEQGDVLGILMDKDFLSIYDNEVQSGHFYNPAQLVTNIFMHQSGSMNACLFANATMLVAK